MDLVFLINIILVKQMVREAGFKVRSFLAKPLCGTSQTRERCSALPASTLLIHISPKKDTRIIRIDSNLAVVLYLFCKNMLHALEGVQSTQTSQGVRVSNIWQRVWKVDKRK